MTTNQDALRMALDALQYAAAPFFSKPQRINRDGEISHIQPTTQEWWEGLREQIETAHAAIEAAIPAKSEDEVREECAKVCDGLVWALDHAGNKYRRPADAERCAAAIRALPAKSAEEVRRETLEQVAAHFEKTHRELWTPAIAEEIRALSQAQPTDKEQGS